MQAELLPLQRVIQDADTQEHSFPVPRDTSFILSGRTYGGNLPLQNDNDGCFPLGVWSGLRGTTGLRCLVRQVPHLTHIRPGVESSSSSSLSLSSVPDALTCHCQDGQHGGGVSHQSPGGLPGMHREQACAPASSLGTGQVFVPESGSCPRGPEPSGGFLVKTETQVGEWMLNRRTVDQIWERFGAAAVGLFASQESTQCPLWFSLSHPASLGIDALVHPWSDMKLYAFPPGKLIPAVLRRVKTCRLRLLLVVPFLPSHTWFLDLVSLLKGEERPILSASGQDLAPMSRDLEVMDMADHRPPLALDLSDRVRETIGSARALSTRKLYSSKWRVFESWYLANAVDPVNCPVGSVLEFLQHKFLAGAATTTLRVYVALSLLEWTRTMYPWVDIVWCPPLCMGLSA